MPYATTSDVQARNPYRAIGASTSPTATQVTQWITETEAILNGALKASDIYAAYTGDALEILKSWVVDRVSGLVRMAYAAAGGDGENDDGKDLVEKFDQLINDIRDRPLFYGSMLLGGEGQDEARRLRGHVLDNADGMTVEDYAPAFEKARREDQF